MKTEMLHSYEGEPKDFIFRSKISILWRDREFDVERYDLRSPEQSFLNGKPTPSLFTGEFYMKGKLPMRIVSEGDALRIRHENKFLSLTGWKAEEAELGDELGWSLVSGIAYPCEV